jgi:hypothetical protein
MIEACARSSFAAVLDVSPMPINPRSGMMAKDTIPMAMTTSISDIAWRDWRFGRAMWFL